MKDHQESTDNIQTINRKRPGNPFKRMRVRKRTEGQKFAALFDAQVVPNGVASEDFAANITEKMTNLPGNRPIAAVGSPSNSPQKRPKYVLTPGGTRLDRDADFGLLLTFSNLSTENLNNAERSVDSVLVKEILRETPPDNRKLQALVITPQLLKNAKRAVKGGQRRGQENIPDQNTVMAKRPGLKQQASATKIASLAGICQNDSIWEWLHLIAFMIKGPSAQTPDNLTGGTKAANTNMIFLEDEVVYLVEELGQEIRLIVEAKEVGCHLSKEIRYTIVTDTFTLPFVINTQTINTPNEATGDYIHSLVETSVEETLNLLEENPPKQRREFFAAAPPKLPSLFFAKESPVEHDNLGIEPSIGPKI